MRLAIWDSQRGTVNANVALLNNSVPAAVTVSGLLTAAQLLAGIITITQGGGAPSAQQLPTGAALQAALPANFAINDTFDLSVINASVVDAEDATVTTNTGMTLVGSMDFPAHSGPTIPSSGILRFQSNAPNTFSVYRVG